MGTNVSEEPVPSFVRGKVITLKIEAVCSFEMLITDHTRNPHSHENLKYNTDVTILDLRVSQR
jgi:hypothetical protein